MRTSLWIVTLIAGILQLSGLVCASYGVLRESFADLAEPKGVGEGRFGEGTFGGGPTALQEVLINVGTKTGLLPSDKTLTIDDKKANAALAIAGVLLAVLGTIIDLVLKFASR